VSAVADGWHLYLLDCDGRSIYTGITTDVARRVAEHAAGKGRAAKYTRGADEVRLLYAVALGDRSLAARAEHRLRRLSRPEKVRIARDVLAREALLERLGLAD
jgi:putative endonuclease